MTTVTAQVLLPGSAKGRLLVLEEALSFWGGFDPATGDILDVHHPQAGQNVKETVLALPETRGSGGTPASIAEAIRIGTAPVAFITAKPDINLVTGCRTAFALYGRTCPVYVLMPDDFAMLDSFAAATLRDDGRIELSSP